MKPRLPLLILLWLCLSTLHAQESRTSQHPVFDAAGRLSVLITYTYDSTGTVATRALQAYSPQGLPTRQEVYAADDQLLYTEANTYDRHGNRVSSIQTAYDDEGAALHTTYRYRYSRLADGSWRLASIRQNGTLVFMAEE